MIRGPISISGDIQSKNDLFAIRPMVFIETVFQFNGLGMLIFVCAGESHRCAVIMDLFCFKQIHRNGICGQFRHKGISVCIEKPVKVFGNLIVIVN